MKKIILTGMLTSLFAVSVAIAAEPSMISSPIAATTDLATTSYVKGGVLSAEKYAKNYADWLMEQHEIDAEATYAPLTLIGDMGNDASGDAYTSVVEYINDKTSGIASESTIGSLNDLTTDDQTSIVDAINELDGAIDTLNTALGDGFDADNTVADAIGTKQDILTSGTGGNISASNGVSVTAADGTVSISGVTATATGAGVVTLNTVTDTANAAIEAALADDGVIGAIVDSIDDDIKTLDDTIGGDFSADAGNTVADAIDAKQDALTSSATVAITTNTETGVTTADLIAPSCTGTGPCILSYDTTNGVLTQAAVVDSWDEE